MKTPKAQIVAEATAPGSLAALVGEFGQRSGIAGAAHKALEAAGHKFTLRTVQRTIAENGGNSVVVAAVLDAVEAERATRAKLAQRVAALSQSPTN